MATFCSLFSGSSGNCSLIDSGEAAVLIDAGTSAKSISLALKEIGSDINRIGAIFVTHEHSDHIKGLAVLSSRLKIPIYANKGTIDGILDQIPRINTDYIQEMATGETVEIKGMSISSFSTSHDSNESVGYRAQTFNGKNIAVVTDLGFVSETVISNIINCEIVMIESNHDLRMLQNGRYPYFLKRRIMSDKGHLSNDACAAILPLLVENGTRHIFLAHLSHDNNMPELAVQTAVASLQMSGMKQGADYEIEAANRLCHSKICCL